MNLYTISSMVTFRDSGESWNLTFEYGSSQTDSTWPNLQISAN